MTKIQNPIHPYLFILLLPILVISGCGDLDISFGPLLYNVSVSDTHITPNADGDTDVTGINYSLRHAANLSIYFENEVGERFYFRRDRRRAPGDYGVQWGGAVDEVQVLETANGTLEILSWVLPDGQYTWTIEAVADNGEAMAESGTITLADGDTTVPELRNFAVVPPVFRPNQDGLRDDWVSISYYLSEDVANIQVYLINEALPDLKYYITEDLSVNEPTEQRNHNLRYEGGLENNAEPPPDGQYAIIAEAFDAAGNRVRVTQSLTIEDGGKPRADVVRGEIYWQDGLELSPEIIVPLNDQLCFKTFVKNEGAVPIRTSGPWPGETYAYTENSNTLAEQHQNATKSADLPEGDESWWPQAGVWRFGITFDTAGTDFPYRWAIGRHEDLEMIIDDEGNEQWYLMPGEQGEVKGCITMN